jgi:hypothetical protein
VPWAVFCLLALLLCLVGPYAVRIFVSLFFLIMAVGVNIVMVLAAPDQFVVLPLYLLDIRRGVSGSMLRLHPASIANSFGIHRGHYHRGNQGPTTLKLCWQGVRS